MKSIARLLACFVCLAAGAHADDFAEKKDSNWPAWRGPDSTGVAEKANPPSKWSETENIKWKIEIPGRGNSTPVIWEDRVFILTAVATGKKIEMSAEELAKKPHPQVTPDNQVYTFRALAYDRATGKTLWEHIAKENHPHQSHHRKGSYASPSPVTDGERVYAFFGSEGLYCYDLAGKLLWQKDMGRFEMRMSFGEGSSPVLYKNMLIVNVDAQTGSFITALDKTTGNEIWRVAREEQTCWSTPVIIEHEGKAEVAVNATRRVRSYDVSNGKLLWEAGGQTLNAIPTVLAGHGLVFATSGFRGNVFKAIKLGQTGDLTENPGAIAWELTKNAPYVPSPILWGEEVYILDDNGTLACFDAKTGKPHYEATRLPGAREYTASLVGGGDKIYATAETGETVVVKRGKTLEVVGDNPLDQTFYASPAIAGNELFLRGEKNLYCIAEKK